MRRCSTCKHLAKICAPALFRNIANPKDPQDVLDLLDYLGDIGRFVKHLELTLHGVSGDILAEIVKRCSDLRCLTVKYVIGYKWYSPELLAAIMLLPALTDLRFTNYPNLPWIDSSGEDITQIMFEPLLGSHGDKLRALKILGKGTLGSGSFASLTRDAPRLVELELCHGLDFRLQHSFAESSTWACATHLQSLTIVDCHGLYADIFTQKLASGVFGQPQKVSLKMHDSSPEKTPPGPIEWTIPALDTFKLDFFTTWEMEHLQLIHAKKVFLSRVCRQRTYKMVIQQIAHKSAFPEATEIHVTTSLSGEDFRELQRVCSARGVKTIARDWDRRG